MAEFISIVGINLQPLDRRYIFFALKELNAWLEKHDGPFRFKESITGATIRNMREGDDSAWTECWQWKREQMAGETVLFLVRGAGGYAGGSYEGKMGVLSDACLDALSGHLGACRRILSRHPTLCTRHRQIGAMGHEACHAVGFRHEDGGLAGAEYVQFPRVRGPWEPTRKGCLWPF